MDNIIAKNKKEVKEYRKKIFSEKERLRKERAKLPFEKKIEILIQLQKFARDVKVTRLFRKKYFLRPIDK